jgi:nucleotide-binding universal stress UspA family protein
MYARILVPIDGSPTSQRGVGEATRLAQALGATVVLLHVVEPYPYGMEFASADTWESLLGGMREQAKALSDTTRAQVAAAGVAVETLVLETAGERVCDVIVEQAAAQRCELVVMGTHGRRGVSHALIGSDAERVLRQSPVPVLSVRGQPA